MSIPEASLAERVYSTGEIADVCRMTKHTILSAIQRGELVSSTTPGGHHRIREGDAAAFLLKHNIPVELLTERHTKVLVVDSDRFVGELISGLLGDDDLDVEIAAGAFEAGAAAERGRPGVVILDMRSVGAGALGLIREIKSSALCRRTKVLAVLSGPAGRSTTEIYEAGADEIIRKPFTVEDLREKARKLLGAREAIPSASAGE